MEEKVAETLKIIEDDGDSFAKRAEMYYRRRPELISFVQDSFRAYRSLAERYDHLSRELQSANRAVASAFPDQVQHPMDDDEDEEKDPGTPSPSNDPNNPTMPKSNVPKVPKIPKKDFKGQSMLITRRSPFRKFSSSAKPVTTTPGLSKGAALAEIDKLQKEILALQTEKEFVRSVYERSYDRYWEIEEQIEGMHKRVNSLQDEFGVGTVIEDNEARTLMAATALKSCQKTLAKLQEIQARSSEEAKVEYERVKEAHEKFEALRDQYISKHMSNHAGDQSETKGEEQKNIEEKEASLEQEAKDVELLREKIKKQLWGDSKRSFTVTEMAERIDELVNKVVNMETAVSCQTGLVIRLRSETDDLQNKITTFEEHKETLEDDSDNMNKKLEELRDDLRRVKNLNRSVRSQDNSLQTHLAEASCNIEHLSGRLHDVKPDEETENLVLHEKMKSDVKTTNEEKEDDAAIPSGDAGNEGKSNLFQTASNQDTESKDLRGGEEDEPHWRQLFLSRLDDKEKILLEEYTSLLKNYNDVIPKTKKNYDDVRTKLTDVEKNNRDGIFELTLQVRELRNALATKDKEINFLHQKLDYPETNPDESPYNGISEFKYTPLGGLMASDSEISSLNLEAIPFRSSFAELLEGRRNVGKSSENIRYSAKIDDPEKFRAIQASKRHSLSTLEKKFRSEIDDLLEENLEFWLRFSTSVHQIQKFQNAIQDLQGELEKIKDYTNREGHSSSKSLSMQSEIRPICRHLREIKTELSLWLENNSVLQDELHGRYSSLCNIQDEISRVAIVDSELSGYQAAKFQGEILNMKQENNKVASELQAGLSLVKRLKSEVEKTLDELDQELEVSNRPPTIKHSSSSRIRIPLRSLLFGAKSKKHKHSSSSSMFACVNPNFENEIESNNDNAPL